MNRTAVALNLQLHSRELARLELQPNPDPRELEIARTAIKHYEALLAHFQ